ncbi:MAG: universal stress protein [Pseudomonadota bacterium]
MKILMAIDGSSHSLQAVRHVLQLAAELRQPPELLLLNVQPNVATGNVKLFIDPGTIEDYEVERGMAALQDARRLLDEAGLSYRYHLSVGAPAAAIVQFAQTEQVALLVLGTHGAGGLAKRLLGSVAQQVAETATMPVTFVR